MYYVYVLYNKKHDRYYIGMTANLERRLAERNLGKTQSKKAFTSWKIVLEEVFETRYAIRIKEKYLKSAVGRRWRKQNVIRPSGATE